jgi:lysophospholipase L1-like esterase
VPQIACPADVSITQVAGSSQAVTFPGPTVTGGAQPVQASCSPASGQQFPLGVTTVTCTATDGISRTATCSFAVSVKGFSIAVTRYAAYGDSLTEGENGLPSFVDAANSYPVKLQASFDAQFPGQGVVVINRGRGGRTVEQTRDDIRGLLPVDRPEAVLILAGYNNLTSPCAFAEAPSDACKQAVTAVAFGIRDGIRRVRESGLGIQYVFVSTLTPPGPYVPGPGVRDRRIRPDAIVSANAGIAQMAAREGATLVDSYARFVGHEAEYTGPDGLHLNPAGYQAIADAFFASITATVPQTPLALPWGDRLP